LPIGPFKFCKTAKYQDNRSCAGSALGNSPTGPSEKLREPAVEASEIACSGYADFNRQVVYLERGAA
jgi:hypothetical protein